MKLAPIVLFTYNRLWHTQQTIDSLVKNKWAKESELFIYNDGAKEQDALKVEKIRVFLRKVSGFKKVTLIERKENWGLAKSIIKGVSEIVEVYEKIIVLEDDMVSSPHFLQFMNEALNLYEQDEKVASIHAYRYPIGELDKSFFMRGADCWGWATWRRAWNNFEEDGTLLLKQLQKRDLIKSFDQNGNYPYSQMLIDQIEGKNDSWAIRWRASTFLKNQYTLYYKESLIQNIGNDNSGTHSQASNEFKVNLTETYTSLRIQEVKEEHEVREKINRFYRSLQPSLYQRLKTKMATIFK